MNIDANVQKLISALLKRWKLLVIFTLIGVLLAYVYTANFTVPTYSSSVEFLAYAVDPSDELSESSSTSSSSSVSGEQVRSSYTSKMNYAMKMLDTYIEIIKTNEFAQRLTDDLNSQAQTNHSVNEIKNTYEITSISNTAIFEVVVTTTDADLSYQIAKQLESTIPEMMLETNSGLVHASVEDKAIKATSHGGFGYAKKCLIGAIAGFVIAGAYIILRSIIDVRIKSSQELTERYNIPVLGTVPEFEVKSRNSKKGAN